jgi:membrane protease YdiL (CAAX protease family)
VVFLTPWIISTFQPSPLLLRLYFDLTGALTILCAAWIMARFADKRASATLGFAPYHLMRDILLGICIGLAWLAASLSVLWFFGWISLQPLGALNASTLIIAGVGLIFNTLIQEVLARSYVFQTIRSQINGMWAIFITSLLFMLYHAAGLRGAWLPAFNVFSAGVLFGIAYYLTGNLWLPIAIHVTWNFLLGPVSGLAVSGQDLASQSHVFTLQGPAFFTGGEFGIEGSLIVTMTTLIGIALLLAWYPRRVSRASPDSSLIHERNTS